ncbi:MAG TPA: PAS domain-containing protein [Usitatibacter sp.]|nr:PAS domain-containing protein [Usitatibacter sp.]
MLDLLEASDMRLETQLRDSDLLQRVLDAAGLGLWTWDLRTDEVTWSAQAYRIHGLRPGDFAGTGHTYFDLVHPEDRDRVRDAVQAGIARREPHLCEFRIQRPGGELAWVTSRGQAQYAPDGTPVTMLGTVSDISRLKQTQFALQAALNASRTGTFHWDILTDKLDWDEELDRLFGLAPGSTVRSLEQFIIRVHPEDRQAVIDACARCRDQGADFDQEFRVVWPDGSVHWLYDRGRTFRNSRGEPASMTGACVDITDRKRTEVALRDSIRELRASEDRFRAAATAASDILWTNDPTGRMTGPQPGWSAFTGQSAEEYSGYGWANAVHPDDAQPSIDAWNAAVATGSKFVFEHRLRRHDGAWRTFAIRAMPVRDSEGVIREWVGVHTDVTEVREAQEIIERQNDELRRADARKDVFLATLAHELRNPLAPVRTAAEVLMHPGLTQQQLSWACGVVQRQSKHMAHLLDDLLDLARITQGKLQLKRELASLQAIVDTAIESTRPLVDRKTHRLAVDIEPGLPMIDGDPVRLSQIVANLVTNAAKYTDPGGSIDVRVERAGQGIAIRVIDNGIGIDPAAMPSLFTMFSQVHNDAGRSDGGLGVGLALVKGLVALHGGSVNAASGGRGQGSTFSVMLPVVEEAAQPAATPRSGANGSSRRRVLVADDNADAADTIAALLRLSGHTVVVAYNGAQALASAQSAPPDVAILDIGMPGMDGYDLARAIRTQPWGRAVTLVAVTGWGQSRDRERAREAGFQHHITKPVDPLALQSLVETVS